jgi:adenosylcobyric acid synthase
VPYVKLDLDEEDSVSERLRRGSKTAADAKVRIAVVRLPFISNYTDFTIFENIPGVSLFYATSPEELEDIDIVILPGTKNTLGDLTWLYKEGFAAKIGELAGNGGLVIGICGGFQMLGRCITDPECSETGGEAKGLSLLHVDTVFEKTKNLRQVSGTIGNLTGVYAPLSGMEVTGYEIHMGESTADTDTFPVIANENVLGTYIHGIFDSADLTQALLKLVYDKKGITEPVPEIEGAFVHQEKELNRLADVLRQSLDWEMIYRIIGI